MKRLKRYGKNIAFNFRLLLGASKGLFMAKTIISFVQIASTYMELYLIREIINKLGSAELSSLPDEIIIPTLLFAILIVVSNLTAKLSKHINYRYQDRISMHLDSILVDKISSFQYSIYDDNHTLNKIADTRFLLSTVETLPDLLFSFATSTIKIIITLFVLAKLSVLASVSIIVLVLLSVLINKKANDAKWNTDRQAIIHLRKMDYYKECVGDKAYWNVKLFDCVQFFISKYTDIWNKWYSDRVKLYRTTVLLAVVSTLLLSLTELSTLALSLHLYIQKEILLGDIIFYFSIIQELEMASESYVYSGANLVFALEELTCIRELLKTESFDELGAKKTMEKYEIQFDGVWFKYPGQEEYVLRDCSFIIRENQTIGLVGKNGAGKSTIVKLILALYSPSKGKILLNGIDYREYDIHKLRSKIGILFQDYNRYSLTLKENISLSELESIDNQTMLIEALSNSDSLETISIDKKGADVQLTKRFDGNGVELSTGQWQKVALGRAFFGNKSLYLLDEPSSSLDALAEDKVMNIFNKLVQNRSGLIVTHRLSSLNLVDRIVFLHDGKIAEYGSAEELIQRRGLFANFFETQARRYI